MVECASVLALWSVVACGDDDKHDENSSLDGAVVGGDSSVVATLDGSLDGSLGRDATVAADGAVIAADGEVVAPDASGPSCATSCDDAVDCTIDSCEGGKCEHRINDDACAAGSSCNATTGCQQGKACSSNTECADTDPCTTNERCNTQAARCEYDVLDHDGDGYPPASCGGADCDDSRGLVSPSASETCNGIDDDCDGTIDDHLTLTANEVCTNGELGCTTGLRLCEGACVDEQTDPGHCGSCGVSCDSGETCSAGRCSCTVGGTVMMCNGQDDSCADTSKSEAHCGSCDNHCADGFQNGDVEACINGSCVSCGGESQPCCEIAGLLTISCLPGLTCDGTPGTAGSNCTCGAGSIKCDDTCTDLKTDELNCGSCGTLCRLDEACTADGCQPCGELGEVCCSPLGIATCGGDRTCGPDNTCVVESAGNGQGGGNGP